MWLILLLLATQLLQFVMQSNIILKMLDVCHLKHETFLRCFGYPTGQLGCDITNALFPQRSSKYFSIYVKYFAIFLKHDCFFNIHIFRIYLQYMVRHCNWWFCIRYYILLFRKLRRKISGYIS